MRRSLFMLITFLLRLSMTSVSFNGVLGMISNVIPEESSSLFCNDGSCLVKRWLQGEQISDCNRMPISHCVKLQSIYFNMISLKVFISVKLPHP